MYLMVVSSFVDAGFDSMTMIDGVRIVGDGVDVQSCFIHTY
jgi:hypothetical protein